MDYDFPPTAGGLRGINFDNYFPSQKSYNSVVYYHKKFLNETKQKKHLKKTGIIESLMKSKSNKAKKFDAKQNTNPMEADYLNPGLEHTLRFAKNLVPVVIPTTKEVSSPIIYTVKMSKKHKRCDKKSKQPNTERDLTCNKNMQKRVPEKKMKIKADYHDTYNTKESIDPSTQNTLDDLNLNINQSCSFSESTEIKYKKTYSTLKKNNARKYFVSSSLDALATESLSGECNKIKIHLMNESDKELLAESIKKPILNAISDCLPQLTKNKVFSSLSTELKTTQKIILCNNEKLDDVLKKLSRLEDKMSTYLETTKILDKSPKALSQICKSARKASKLEELGEDIIEVKGGISDQDSSDEVCNVPKRRLRCRGKSVVVAINENYGIKENRKETLGCGEEVPGGLNASSSISQQGVQPDRPNRIPARFCWTDADRLK